ncbi:tRNA-specific adenosine deaminase 2 [Tribolium madens]|uniref:tRNA-specific adenosine deaminase 2 n=1 Tax=Tribolium madens TaxID=41895 RepID=UPI001CF73113|nr:tRNA-specific adenosine deaminase 2 [Tribolium madens]
MEPQLTKTEQEFMEQAFRHAHEALAAQEVPVGCIFVHNHTQIIAFGRNTVNETKNATRHAEINCIEQVTDYCRTNNLNLKQFFKQISVFVTVEPCIMCINALYDLEVESIVFGCKNDRFGGRTVFDVGAMVHPKTLIKGGFRAEEAMDLLKEFYKGVNPSAPPSKVKVRGKKT